MKTFKTTISALAAVAAVTASGRGDETGASAPSPGLKAEYFDNAALSGEPKAVRVDEVVGLFYGDTSGAAAEGLPEDYWSVRWTGAITVPETGTWGFDADVDDGLRLWIDGQLVIDHWDKAPDTYLSVAGVPVLLEAGRAHSLKAEYQDFFSDAYCVLRWTSPSGHTEVVPVSAYSLEPGVTPPPPPPPPGESFDVLLTSASTVVTGPFTVNVTASEPLQWIDTAQVDVRNGVVNGVGLAGNALTLDIVPHEAGSVFVTIPAGIVGATSGTTNNASATLHLAYSAPQANKAPSLTWIAPQTGVRGGPAVLATNATDPEGAPLTFSAENLPPGLGIDPASGVITGTIAPDAADHYDSRVRVSDGEHLAEASVPWTILSAPTATVNGLKGEYFADTTLQQKVLTRIDPNVNFLWWDGTSPSWEVPDNHFSVRWTGKLRFDTTQIHSLFADVDDGIRVWVAGHLVIDKWNAAPGTYHDVPSLIRLQPATAPGLYSIVVEFQDVYSDALVRLKWEAPGLPRQVIPADHFFTTGPADTAPVLVHPGDAASLQWQRTFLALSAYDPDAQGLHFAAEGLPPGLIFDEATRSISGVATTPGVYRVAVAANDGVNRTLVEFDWTVFPFAGGLKGQYFDGPLFKNLVAEREDPAVRFYWGADAPFPGMNADDFCAIWTGSVVPPATETYTFLTLADDCVRLWVNGRLIIDKWDGQGVNEAAGSIDLVAGQPATLRLEYAEKGGSALAELCWFSPSVSKRLIPQTRLIPITQTYDATYDVPESAEEWLTSPTLAAVHQDLARAAASATVEVGPDGVAHYVFTVPIGLVSLYGVEASEDLVHWTVVGNEAFYVPSADGFDHVRVYAGPVSPSEGGKPQMFFRLSTRH